MLNLSLSTNKEKQRYDVRCNNCGKFISRKEIEEDKAKYHFIPDNEFSSEEAYWIHIKC